MYRPRHNNIGDRKGNLGEIAGRKKSTVTKTITHKRNSVRLASKQQKRTDLTDSCKPLVRKTAVEYFDNFKEVRGNNLKKLDYFQTSESKEVKRYLIPESSKESELISGGMACQVEMINGNGALNDRESSPDIESDIEIMTLKQTLKEKLININLNDNMEIIAGGSSSTLNGNGTIENGHADEKVNNDSEFENDEVAGKHTPKRGKGKFAKGKKEKNVTVSKSKRHTPVKKVIDAAVDEESVISEHSWASIELENKDVEEDDTVDVVGDTKDDFAAILKEDDYSVKEQVLSIRMESSDVKLKETPGPSNVFSRLRDSMRFSISPQKQEPTSSSHRPQSLEKEFNSYRNLSGRRALHRTPPTYSFKEAEPSALKRKADSEIPDAPQRKYFITTFSERSPGWKFFSSPFSRFWSTRGSPESTTVSSSTPLRNLHEDIEENSMAVNVNESLNISSDEELDILTNQTKIQDQEDKPVIDLPNNSSQASWKCSIM